MKTIRVINSLTNEIGRRINLHHELYDFKIDSLAWENILHKSLLKAGFNSEWITGSHSEGVDIYVDDIRISCKGGTVSGKRNPRLKISSHRTTRFKTLQEKLEFISEEHEDVIWSLVQMSKNLYRLHIFEKPNFKEFEWKEIKSGWSAIHENGNKASISRSMSDQLWFDINYENFIKNIEYYDFTVSE